MTVSSDVRGNGYAVVTHAQADNASAFVSAASGWSSIVTSVLKVAQRASRSAAEALRSP